MSTVYAATSLTGGYAGSLDTIDGKILSDGDIAIVSDASTLRTYTLDADSGLAESSPNVIAPNLRGGLKRWILLGVGTGDAITDVDSYGGLNAAITAIGATPSTVRVTTEQTMTASATIPSTLKVIIEQGGSIVTTGFTLAVSGTIQAGPYQIFSGTGTVTLGTAVPEIFPEWFGALSTAVNNAAALTMAVTAMGGVTGYKTLVLSQNYPITGTLTINGLRHFAIDFRGGYISSTGCSAVIISNCLEGEIRGLNVVSSDVLATAWAAGYSGVTLNNVMEVKLDVQRISGYAKGLNFEPTGAGSYVSYMSNITLNRMRNNKYDIYIKPGTQGYVTELNFFGGSFGLDSGVYDAVTGDYCAYIETGSLYGVNNVRFYSPTFETKHNGIYAANGAYFLLSFPRYEGVAANWLSGVFTRSIFMFGANTGHDNSKINLTTTSQYNTWIGPDYTSNTSLFFESDYGSYGFKDQYSHAIIHRTEHLATINATRIYDAAGTIQIGNKQYEGTAAPTTGSFRHASVVWNSSPTVGQPMGWICNSAGTMGTLSGITASGTSGDAFVTVNSTTGLWPGGHISIVGVAGTKTIIGIKGLVVHLSSTINATVTNAAVAYVAATWLAMPNL